MAQPRNKHQHPHLRPAVSVPDTESVGEPEARALAAAVAGVVRRGGEHLVVVTALGLGVGEGGHGEAAEEGEGDGGLHIQRKGLRAGGIKSPKSKMATVAGVSYD